MDTLHLLNGDRLQGTLVGVDGARGTLTWRHAAMPGPLRCQLAALDRVELRPVPGAGRPPAQHLVQLVNGDRLAGDVVTLDATQLVLKTWYAGSLHIARERLAGLAPAAAVSDVLYAGPTANPAGWLTDDGQVERLISHGKTLLPPNGRAIGRVIPNLGDQVRFDFTVAHFESSFFAFRFFSKDPQSLMNSEAYFMKAQMGTFSLGRDQGMRSFGWGSAPPQPKPTHVTVLADRRAHHLVLLLDGRFTREFTDAEENPCAGDLILFYQQGSGADVRVSKIRITRWDGRLPVPEGNGGAVAEDLLTFTNGDTLSGVVRSIAVRQLVLASPYAQLAVPLEHVGRVRFATRPPAPAPGPVTTVRCCFNAQDALTVQIATLADGTLSGTAAGIGAVQLPLGALQRLVFNPAAPRATDDEDNDL